MYQPLIKIHPHPAIITQVLLIFVGYITFIGFWAHPLINNKTVCLKELFKKKE